MQLPNRCRQITREIIFNEQRFGRPRTGYGPIPVAIAGAERRCRALQVIPAALRASTAAFWLFCGPKGVETQHSGSWGTLGVLLGQEHRTGLQNFQATTLIEPAKLNYVDPQA